MKGKVLYSFMIVLLFLSSFSSTYIQAEEVKNETLTFELSKDRTRTEVITIPNLGQVENVTVNNGNVTYTVYEEDVEVSVSGGSVNETVLISGAYTPAETKSVTNQASANYNKDGFLGTLTRYVHSGTLTPAHTKTVEVNRTNARSMCDWVSLDSTKPHWGAGGGWHIDPATVSYNADGYSGILPLVSYTNVSCNNGAPTHIAPVGTHYNHTTPATGVYRGPVTKPAVDTRVYRYRGNVTKPAVDTRVYEDRYAYQVEITYKEGNFSLVSIPDLTIIPEVTLGENKEKVYGTFTGKLVVEDTRNVRKDWSLKVSSTTPSIVEPSGGFVEGTSSYELPKGSLGIKPVESIKRVDTTGLKDIPIIVIEEEESIDNQDVTIIRSSKENGRGTYELSFPNEALSVLIDPTTTKVDEENYSSSGTPYKSTIKWDLILAP